MTNLPKMRAEEETPGDPTLGIWAVTALPWLLDKGVDAALARLGTSYEDLIYQGARNND